MWGGSNETERYDTFMAGLYAAYVEPCVPLDRFQRYELGDMSGLENIQ